jgi:hypothetical protein
MTGQPSQEWKSEASMSGAFPFDAGHHIFDEVDEDAGGECSLTGAQTAAVGVGHP